MAGTLRRFWVVLCVAMILPAGAPSAEAVELLMKDGRALKGNLVPLTGISAMPDSGSELGYSVYMLNDNLRQTYVGRWQIRDTRSEQGSQALERFKLEQKVSHALASVRSVGPLFDIKPFSDFGVRRMTMMTQRGPEPIVQAITEITATYTKLEGVTHTWDMRIATNSIPFDKLTAILSNHLKRDSLDLRRKLASFYLQCERYEDAAKEIDSILTDFPDQPELNKQLETLRAAIREARGSQMLNELTLRREAGQHRTVFALLKKFPTEGPSGETIQAALQMAREYETQEAARVKLLKAFQDQCAKLDDKYQRERVERVLKEMSAELSLATLPRLAAFREMADDESLKPEEKLALAISGWLVDSKGATTKLSTALSLVQVRSQIYAYFAAANKVERGKVLASFQSEEAATAPLVAGLLANMKPPVVTEPQSDDPLQSIELQLPGRGNAPPVRYLVQLPPEYNPYQRYPAIVSLHGARTTPELQIEWWAGPITPGGCAPDKPHDAAISSLPRPGPAITRTSISIPRANTRPCSTALRDACRRFSIDTDRVFLSGHSIGGDAAWDIGLAHPDLWAGVIAICAKADRYAKLYWRNARLLPLYFICGELDGSRNVVANAPEWDRYLRTSGFNTTVVQYLGRGHEHFSDEILRLFDWMGHQRRNFFPRDFATASMRPWDNFFWWVELSQMPEKTMVEPEQWAAKRGNVSPMSTKGTVTKTDTVSVQTGAGHVTVWLSPEMIDIKRRVSISVNGRRLPHAAEITPDVATILEDVRTRGDRVHPFWAKVDSAGGRAAAGK